MISINQKTEILSTGCLMSSTSKMYLMSTAYQNFGLQKKWQSKIERCATTSTWKKMHPKQKYSCRSVEAPCNLLIYWHTRADTQISYLGLQDLYDSFVRYSKKC